MNDLRDVLSPLCQFLTVSMTRPCDGAEMVHNGAAAHEASSRFIDKYQPIGRG